MSAIVIDVGKQTNGVTFRLSYETKKLLATRIPWWSPATPASDSIFLWSDRQWDYERMSDPMWTQVAMLLTGLSEGQIRELGGFKFISPADDHQVVYESLAA